MNLGNAGIYEIELLSFKSKLEKKVCILKFEFECGGVLNDAMPLSCCSSYCTFDRGTTIAGIFGPIK